MKFVNFNGTLNEKMLDFLASQEDLDIITFGKESVTTMHNDIMYIFSPTFQNNYEVAIYTDKIPNKIFKRICHKESEIMPIIEDLHKTKDIDEAYAVIQKAKQSYKMNINSKTK